MGGAGAAGWRGASWARACRRPPTPWRCCSIASRRPTRTTPTDQQLRETVCRDDYADQDPVLVAAFDAEGAGDVYEVEEITMNNGHLQLTITLPARRWKFRRRRGEGAHD
jgi:hypothetical protein